MKNIKNLSFKNLSEKIASIVGVAIAALTGVQISASIPVQSENIVNQTVHIKDLGKSKPMPILKINSNNLNNIQLVSAHRSHSSHSSHSSHQSHYSHRSGAMFS